MRRCWCDGTLTDEVWSTTSIRIRSFGSPEWFGRQPLWRLLAPSSFVRTVAPIPGSWLGSLSSLPFFLPHNSDFSSPEEKLPANRHKNTAARVEGSPPSLPLPLSLPPPEIQPTQPNSMSYPPGAGPPSDPYLDPFNDQSSSRASSRSPQRLPAGAEGGGRRYQLSDAGSTMPQLPPFGSSISSLPIGGDEKEEYGYQGGPEDLDDEHRPLREEYGGAGSYESGEPR